MNLAELCKDPIWRLNNFYHIVDKSGHKVKFKQNSIQKLLNEPVKRKRILKARQVGISTNELLKQLDFVLFNENKTAMILAHERDTIEKLFTIVRRAYEFMDDDMKPELDRGGGSKYSMYFPKNNSRIFCDIESVGSTINWLHVSEAALSLDPSRIKFTQESVPINGIVTHETTARGMNHFYEQYMDRDSDFKNYFFPWFMHDEYQITDHEIAEKDLTEDELALIVSAKTNYRITITMDQIAYRRFKERELKGLLKQEYPENDADCFLTSGENPFSLSIIKPMFDKSPNPIKTINGIRIYKEYEQKSTYVIGADTAEGVGGDKSAAHVFKVQTREQVASFHGNLKPSEFAEKLVEMADLYTSRFHPLLAVERNNHGHAVLLKLDEILNYPNIFKHTEDKSGWITDKVTRPVMIHTFIEGVENGTIKLNDRDTLSECLTLTNNNGKIEAEETKHDDLFIAACIAGQMCILDSGVLELYSNIGSSVLTD